MKKRLETRLTPSLTLCKNFALTALCCAVSLTGGLAHAANKCSNIGIVHGSDNIGNSGIGISAWLSRPDGTFGPLKYSMGGFVRNTIGTEVFGDSTVESTRFVDTNNDGAVDIVHISEDDDNSIRVYLNNKDNTFQTTPILTKSMAGESWNGFTGTANSQQSFMCDTNKDGNIDYIFGDDTEGLHVYFGKGNGTFSTSALTTKLTPVDSFYGVNGLGSEESFHMGDFNGDGICDLGGITQVALGWFFPPVTGKLAIWPGKGDGSFQANASYTIVLEDTGSSDSSGTGSEEYSTFADPDGDGDLDYVHVEAYDNTPSMWVFKNPGNGNIIATATKTDALPPVKTRFPITVMMNKVSWLISMAITWMTIFIVLIT